MLRRVTPIALPLLYGTAQCYLYICRQFYWTVSLWFFAEPWFCDRFPYPLLPPNKANEASDKHILQKIKDRFGGVEKEAATPAIRLHKLKQFQMESFWNLKKQ